MAFTGLDQDELVETLLIPEILVWNIYNMYIRIRAGTKLPMAAGP